MSGGNRIAKYLETDREGFISLHTRDTEFHNIPLRVALAPGATITGTQFIHDILINAAGPYTGPSPAGMLAALALDSHIQPGQSQWSISIENTTGAPQTINMPAGFTPAAIVIPAGGYMTYIWQLDTLIPPTFTLKQTLPGGSAAPSVTSVFGRTGAVTAMFADYDSTDIQNASTVPGANVTLALNSLQTQANTALISFNGRTAPAVIPTAGDYTAAQVTYTPPAFKIPLTATTVQAALDYLASDPYAFSDTVSAQNLTAAWNPVPFTLQLANSRQQAVGFSFIQAGNGIQITDVNSPQMAHLSAVIHTSATALGAGGNLAIRIKRVGGGTFITSQNINPHSGINEIQVASTSVLLNLAVNDLLTVEVLATGTFLTGPSTVNSGVGPQFNVHLLGMN